MERTDLAVGLGNPGVILTNEVDSHEGFVKRKGQAIPPHFDILSTDAASETFDCHEQCSAFCLNIAKTKLADGCWLDADVTVFLANGRQLQAQDNDQLTEVKGCLMEDSYECSVTRKGQPFPSPHEIVPTNRHTRVMRYATAAGETLNGHEQSSAFCLTDAQNSFYAKEANETEKHTLAAGFEATADTDIIKTKPIDDYWLNADVTDFGATGKPLQGVDKDQLAEGICSLMDSAECEKISPGENVSPLNLYSMMKAKYVDPSIPYARQVVEMIGKAARVKQPVASLDLSSDSGISAYSMHGTKSVVHY